MAALLLRGELVLEMDTGGAGLDHGFHELEGVERTAEARLGVSDDRRVPRGVALALLVLDLIGALERLIDPLHHRRNRVRGLEALIGFALARAVGSRRRLPAPMFTSPDPRSDRHH